MPRVSTKKEVIKTDKESALKKDTKTKRKTSKKAEIQKVKKRISLLDLKPKPVIKKRKKESLEKETITLPQEPSLNLIHKVNHLNFIKNPKTTKVMSNVASISGYTFIVTGLYLSFTIGNIQQNNTKDLLASTACIDTGCLTTSSTTETTSSSLDLSEKIIPSITFPADFSSELKEDFLFTLEVKSVTYVGLSISSDITGEEIVLALKNKDGDRYSFLIPYETLKSSTYTINLKTLSIDGSKYFFTGPKFIINKGETSTEIKATTEITATTTSTETIAINTKDPTLKLDGQTDGKFKFITTNASDYMRVEMYALPGLSATPIFLGKAVKKDNIWVYFLDQSSLPINTYNIFAKAIKSGSAQKTKPISITIKKAIETVAETTSTESAVVEPLILSEKVKETLENSNDDTTNENLIDKRVAYYENSVLENEENTEEKTNDTETLNSKILSTGEQTEVEADKLLSGVDEELNKLLKKYASAIQGDDENIKRLATEELNKLRDSLIIKAKTQTSTKDIAEQIAFVINLKFESLLEKVAKYEGILKERAELIAKDTDNDGITDFDEVNLYKTNPNSPDTDSDGITDGIEIVKGYSPLDSSEEAVINFQSPKEVNYVDEQNLFIESITPVIKIKEDETKEPLIAEIKGRALPNSFVTLYIYSSPTIVTVKADSDGNFVYTLEKELEEGEHEIYVAMTDNGGNVVARSKPFQFVKTAEAFTPVDSNNEIVLETRDIHPETSLSSYNTVAAMGVISFGLILLMLGHTLRNRPEEEEEEEEVKQHDSDS